MMQERILVVDDEPVICEVLEFNLSSEGYLIDCVHSAEEALKILSPEHSLILLDVMLGDMSGFRMAELLRKRNNRIPIIFLTAKDSENDMLTGFSTGGDDYIMKPFSIKEVSARVKAVLRRMESKEVMSKGRKLIFNDMVIDFHLKEITVDGQNVQLTKTEFEILSLLAGHPDRIFSREDIINVVRSDSPYITERTVDVHIARLRKKLGSYASLISNRVGFGYRFNRNL
jgi:DNA-binding response OmpR family regulator